MPDKYEEYVSPFVSRYTPEALRKCFGDRVKFTTWRKLWTALAEAQKELGLPVTDKQISELRLHISDVDFNVAAELEKKLRHDVMAHIKTYGQQCPEAAGIIHLGATSCFVTDNTDIIIYRDAAGLVRKQLLSVIRKLSGFARKYSDAVTLGYTHLQPAQPVTVGKRACMWLQDLLMDLEMLDFAVSQLRFRGVKGASGTQASALMLFEGDGEKVKKLNSLVAAKMGFDETFEITGQTYPRKADFFLLGSLSGIAQSANKFATDVRLLSSFGEMTEPHGKSQDGSSAMPHKANPMRSERICALARFVVTASLNAAFTAAEHWFERTLDDSANRRIAVPECFMGVSAILNLYLNIAGGLVVNESVISRRLAEQLPFIASEGILMEAVKTGGDRQELHEKLRTHAVEAKKHLDSSGENDFLERVGKDPAFKNVKDRLEELADPSRLAGLSAEQAREFLDGRVDEVLKKEKASDDVSENVKV